MIRTTLTAAALALCSVVSPVIAGERRLLPCQYNGGKWTQVHYIDDTGRNNTFTLEWDDGPRMTYRWQSKDGALIVTDTLSGRWDYINFGNSFTLENRDNGNTIKCLETRGALAAPAPSMADSTKAYCTVVWHDMNKVPIRGPCDFSESNGIVYVNDFKGSVDGDLKKVSNIYNFAFPSAEQGKTYQRDNFSNTFTEKGKKRLEAGITFIRKGQYNLNMYWTKPVFY